MSLFEHTPHPRIAARATAGPVKVADQHKSSANGSIALRLTALVGTMQAAYLFTGLAVIALPSVLGLNWFPSRTLLIVGWISQTLIQLVMLAVLQLGQNLQASASDKRAEATYHDASATYHEASEIQRHLAIQDVALADIATAWAAHQDQLVSQMAADRDVQDQHLEATRALGDSLDVLHRALGTTPPAQPAADPRSAL